MMLPLTKLYDLEMRYLDTMPRQQVLEAFTMCADCLPADLAAGLEDATTDRLRLLLFTARLIHVLRQLRGSRPVAELPRDLARPSHGLRPDRQ
jgi:hypothetical protein